MKKENALFTAVSLMTVVIFIGLSFAAPMEQTPATIAKSIGSVKAINGNVLTLAPSSGPEVAVTVQPNARIVKLGADKDPKNATAIQLSDIQVGDMVRARGTGSTDGKSIAALEVMVISSSAIASVSDQMKQDWQKRGIGGIVTAVDASAATATISIPSLIDKKTLVIHASNTTVIKRYAPDSAKYENAQSGSLDSIHSGDQLRARGDRSADGNDFTAVEIIAGTFPYVEGPIKSVDASSNTLTVQDVLSKKAVTLRVSAESQLHQIPADAAQKMAFMLKAAKSGAVGAGSSGAGSAGAGTSKPAASGSAAPNAAGAPVPPAGNATGSGYSGGAGAGSGQRGNGGGLARMLDQTPTVTLNDLHKGDVIAILATEGTPSSGGTVIKLFSGVEPILTAAPSASQAMMLTPWSLGGGAPGGGDQ